MASYVTLIANVARIEASASGNSVTFQTYNSTTAAWTTQWTLNTATGAITLAAGQTTGGNQTVSGTLGVTGATTLSDTLKVTDAVTMDSTLSVADAATADGFNPSVTVNSLAGTTAGTVSYVQPFAGSGYKKVLLWFDGYENDTTTAQTITYPTAFATAAGVTGNTSGLTLSTSLTTLTITAPDATTTYTGFAEAEGW